LNSFDDFPIHQSSAPIAETSTSDINHYDRSFFNGYVGDGSLYFGVAMGLYPNRHVADAAFSVMTGDRQISVFTSQRAPADRRDATRLGPISVDVVEAMRVHHVTVTAPEHGLSADLTYTARSAAIEEPRYKWKIGQRTLFDYTRFTQFGTWTGWIAVDERRHALTPTTWGSRDRSWGVRPVGEAATTGAPVGEPQFFWLWSPVNFPSLSTHLAINEDGDGHRWHQVGVVVRPETASVEAMRAVDYRIRWRLGTRRAERFEYDLLDSHDHTHTVCLQPRGDFQMSGLGYGHPDFGHGFWKGEAATASERITLPVDTPCARKHLHVQTLCDATYTAPDGTTEVGMGIVEQLPIGRHPTGLTGLFDGYTTSDVPVEDAAQR
jgi:hypothetical protein